MSIFGQKKYKIGIDARMYGYAQTGIGNYIRHLLKYVLEFDKENEYVVFLLPDEYRNFNASGKRIKKIKVSSKWYGWKEQCLFPFELYKENLDLMHFTHFNSPVLYFKKSIVTIHDIIPYFFPGHKMKSLLRRTGFMAVFFSSVRKASRVIAVSENTKNDIAKYFGTNKEKIVTIYEGVDKEFKIIKDNLTMEWLKNKYRIRKPFIFYTGVWRNHKNLTGLVKAFFILKNKYKKDFQLVLGGREDPYYPEARNAWKKLGLEKEIIRPGFIDQKELPLFYGAAKLFVIPSFYEGFGLTGLEAMACGTPVASSGKTSLPEVLEDAAVYFNPDSPEEMAEKINMVLSDEKLYNKLREKGFAQVKKYSWEKMGKETMDLYGKILKRN